MAQPVNTFSTHNAIGIREDLQDVIYDVSPTDTPFMSGAAKISASNTFHEWQTDELDAAASDNAHIEGDDTTPQASTATVRLGNYTQIFKKSAVVSRTQNTVDKAGRSNEMAYQVYKRTREIKRDIESSLLANVARSAGSSTAARRLAGAPTWFTTNTDAGALGADASTIGQATRTDGTQRAFTEDLLKDVLQLCWDNGGDPETIMVGSHNKQVMSGFTGGSTRQEQATSRKITAAVDVYVSDFGELKVVPNRFQRQRDVFLFQMDMWKIGTLDGLKNEPLAKTGDSEKRQLITELTLVCGNEKSSGLIADVTTA